MFPDETRGYAETSHNGEASRKLRYLSVTAPSLAEETSRAYFARTPLVSFGGGVRRFAMR